MAPHRPHNHLPPPVTGINLNIIYKVSVRTAQKTPCASVRKTSRCTLCRHLKTLRGQTSEFLVLNPAVNILTT
jgi:hypothetical protein